jgi:hypothetical protein
MASATWPSTTSIFCRITAKYSSHRPDLANAFPSHKTNTFENPFWSNFMAKMKINKSKLIRDVLEASPETKPKEVVETLAKDGHKVSVNLV